MKKLRVLLCLIFVAVFVPWGAACKKTEESRRRLFTNYVWLTTRKRAR